MGHARRVLLGRWLWLAPIVVAGALALTVIASVQVIDDGEPGDVSELEAFLSSVDAAAAEPSQSLVVTARLARVALQSRQAALEDALGAEIAQQLAQQVARLTDAAERLGTGNGDRAEFDAAKAELLETIIQLQANADEGRAATITDLRAVILGLVVILTVGGLIAAVGTWMSERTLARLRRDEVAAQERLAAQNEELARAAVHDPLTGLLNRAGYFEQLPAMLRRARERGSEVAVVYADMDRFKVLNDLRGHQEADRVLKLVAEKLSSWAGDDGIAARLGGDEFAVAVPVASVSEFRADLARLDQTLGGPIWLDGVTIQTSLSVGASLYPHDGTDVDSLTRHADLAMYESKREGGGRCTFFTAAFAERATARYLLEVTLADAIDQGELILESQPIVSIDDGEIVMAEALVRWRHPERGIIPPDEFVPVAEASGIMIPLGEWVIRTAFEEARHWWEQGWRAPVSINLSPYQLRSPDFARYVREQLRDLDLDPSMVVLEVTESGALEDSAAAVQQLDSLREIGITVALDDFGRGHSSLSRLQGLPIDVLKIDREIVAGLGSGDGSDAVLEAAAMLGDRLHLRVVAEGVETSAQVDAARHVGCHAVQGHYLHRPADEGVIRDLFEAHPPRMPAFAA